MTPHPPTYTEGVARHQNGHKDLVLLVQQAPGHRSLGKVPTAGVAGGGEVPQAGMVQHTPTQTEL